ncbi:MAG: FGGY family carbohydrate kinase [Clostridiales bacterium]|nr:FGGY family carbohydrate kinase [Clostridiales bacterium]
MNTLIVDIGTTVVKFYLFEGLSSMLWHTERRFEQRRQGLSVETDMPAVLEGISAALAEAGDYAQVNAIRVDAVALTAQRSSVMPVAQDGEPLAPMMMWQDHRADGICRALAPKADRIHEICGMRPTSVFSAPKIVWLMQNRPEVCSRASRFVGFYEWIAHWLTGEWVTDDSVASRSCLYDLASGRWSDELLELFGIDKSKLCQIAPVGSRLPLSASVSRLLRQQGPVEVVLAGGDQQCAAVGAGCLAPGDWQINAGTGAYILGMMDPHWPRSGGELRFNASSLPPSLLAEASLTHCCTAVDRLVRLMYGNGSILDFCRDAADSLEWRESWRISPRMLGDSSVMDDEQARRKIAEWKSCYTDGEIASALLEGIVDDLASQAASVVHACRGEGKRRVICGGGLTRCGAFCQRLADRLDIEAAVPEFENITALGALVVANSAALAPKRCWEGLGLSLTSYIPRN